MDTHEPARLNLYAMAQCIDAATRVVQAKERKRLNDWIDAYEKRVTAKGAYAKGQWGMLRQFRRAVNGHP